VNMPGTPRRAASLFDGDRLRQARLYHGLRKVDVARKLGMTAGVVGQYEQSRTRPSPGTLAALSLQLGFPPEFFERRGEASVHVDEGQAHFRRLRSTSKLQRDRLLVRLELLADVLARVESHVRFPDVAVPSADVEIGDDAGVEATATAVRTEWGLGVGPIDNVVRLLESKGIIVVRPAIATGDVDAFSTWAAGRPVVVLGSDKDDAARSRFDAGHELGHLVMHHDVMPGHQAVERQAQRFAAAFLMPADAIARELPRRMSWPAYFDLKLRWRVSLQALLYRARSLGVLSPDGYQRAQIYLSRTWGREIEPIDLGPPERPTLLTKAFNLMESRLRITKDAIAADARVPRYTLDDLLADVIQPVQVRPEVPVG
jgi:Zn-dependent peptidase ImmA (M78 family)/transcriptional regulator with XRE-family HTH domain